jgi:hypothetical protein
MALTGRRPAEIFFSTAFSLPPKKLPYPALLFDGQLENPSGSRHQFPSPTSSPSWPAPKKLVQALDTLRTLKSFPSPKSVNTTTGPQLPKYVSAAFGSLDLPWKPGHLRSAYGAICYHKFKLKSEVLCLGSDSEGKISHRDGHVFRSTIQSAVLEL